MNAYSNQANNRPSPYKKMAVGQRVKTIYGIGIITDVRAAIHRGSSSYLDPILATILVPTNPPHIFVQRYSTLLFTDSAVGGEISKANGLAQ